MRNRSTTTGSLSANSCQIVGTRPNGTTFPYSKNTYGQRTVKQIVDVVTPGFFSLKRCGKFLPINPVQIVTVQEAYVPGTALFEDTRYGIHYAGEYTSVRPWSIPVPGPDEGLIDAAVLSAAANAAAAEWDVMTFLAEFKQSADLMAKIGSQFNGFTYNLARQARAFKKNPWKKFRELWLGARYGIRPMMYDFKSAYNAFAKYKDKLEVITGQGHESNETDEATDTGLVPLPGGVWLGRTRESLKQTFEYNGRAYIRYTENIGATGRSFGFDPLTTAWELVPYSFVVDWFVNIGNAVQVIQPLLRGSFLGMSASIKRVTEQELTYYQVGTSYIDGAYSEFKQTKRTEEYVRYPSDVPTPSLVTNLTLPKLVDLAALFVGGRSRVLQTLNQRR